MKTEVNQHNTVVPNRVANHKNTTKFGGGNTKIMKCRPNVLINKACYGTKHKRNMVSCAARHSNRQFKYTVVCQGPNVASQNWEEAMFQDLGSSPAPMGASKSVDAYGSLPGRDVEQADTEQACVRVMLDGRGTWILLPDELIEMEQCEHLLFHTDGSRKCDRPCEVDTCPVWTSRCWNLLGETLRQNDGRKWLPTD